MYSSFISSLPKLTNCIVWGSGNSPLFNSSSTPTITYTDIQGGYMSAEAAQQLYGLEKPKSKKRNPVSAKPSKRGVRK